MPLSKSIVANLRRIGAVLPEKGQGSATNQLAFEVIWPAADFMRSNRLMRGYLKKLGRSDADAMSDDVLQDEFPLIYRLRFLQPESRGGFWAGWEQEFPAVDSTCHFPLASDDYYFYFLADNPRDATDPLILAVDHEESTMEPLQRQGLTAGMLLSIIDDASSK